MQSSLKGYKQGKCTGIETGRAAFDSRVLGQISKLDDMSKIWNEPVTDVSDILIHLTG